jgi:hypothetical protein
VKIGWLGRCSLFLGGVIPLPVPALAVLSVTTQTLVQQACLFAHPAQVLVHVPRGLARPLRAYPPLDLLGTPLCPPTTLSI